MSTDRLEEQVEPALQDAALEEIALDALDSIIAGGPPHNGTILPE